MKINLELNNDFNKESNKKLKIDIIFNKELEDQMLEVDKRFKPDQKEFNKQFKPDQRLELIKEFKPDKKFNKELKIDNLKLNKEIDNIKIKEFKNQIQNFKKEIDKIKFYLKIKKLRKIDNKKYKNYYKQLKKFKNSNENNINYSNKNNMNYLNNVYNFESSYKNEYIKEQKEKELYYDFLSINY